MRLARVGQLIVSVHDAPPGPVDVRAELDAVAAAQRDGETALLTVVARAYPPPPARSLQLYARAVRDGVPPVATAVVLLQDGPYGHVARATIAALLKLRGGAPARVFDALEPAYEHLAAAVALDLPRVRALTRAAASQAPVLERSARTG
ncbi:MAG: hypothetical protein KF901_21495 [Myxococcales bacterium]|nr:hypothetical protein [Myxococcales bacterium]